MSPTRGALRLSRAAVLGASCLLLSLTGHVLAGGAAPSPFALLALTVPVVCLAVLMTAERAGLARISLTLGLTQVGLHEAFMLLAQPHCSVAGMAGHHASHAAGAALSAGSQSAATCAPGMDMAALSTPMLGAHLLAGVATALLLWHGERLLWSLVTWLAIALPQANGARLVPARHRPATAGVRRVARSVVAIGGIGLRGPPPRALAVR